MSGEVSWERVAPERKAIATANLDRIRDVLKTRRTKTFLVVRDGKIIYEWYADDWNAAKPHYTASLAKALVGGTSLLLAWNEGLLSPDNLAARYIPAWRGDPLKSRITLRHLATHSSGIEDAEQDAIPHMELPGWKGAFWRKDPDPFRPAILSAPVIFAPGTEYVYSNPGMAALSYAITASLRGSATEDIRSLLQSRIMGPLEIPDSDWSIGYGKTYEMDGLPLVANWGGGSFTARAIARVGQWMLQRGEWADKPLVDAEIVAQVTAWAGMPDPDRPPGNPQPSSGLAWYTNHDGVWPEVPRDAFAGAGAGNQVLLVVPSLDLVVVRNGGILANDTEDSMFWGGIVDHLFNPLMKAVKEGVPELPYPPSDVIRQVRFAPVEDIQCAAMGSDNWPVTWADDGHLYTSYGDGYGFEPMTKQKLSQGFARVIGSGDSFQGVNIRSESGERLGDGAKGAKASGMLMVDGVLYAWVRNVGNAQLIWSDDHGRTWQWGFKLTSSFGSPAFLNFGRNHAGARDDFVYTYSQAGPSAYESDDGVVLARVPVSRMKDREAYEFFVTLSPDGRPVWSDDIAERGPVFQYPGRCQRVDAVYHPASGRYLLAVAHDHDGSWGIYDAPEPWGPWTTAFHTPYWGLGKTHGYRLPIKWISPDGSSLHLIFSGRRHNGVLWDAFCVRQFSLDAVPRPKNQ